MDESSARSTESSRWYLEWEICALVLLVLVAYFARLTALPVCGEESRWATAAREMVASGDYVAPRQQGTLFPERPPLGSWAMALVGAARGEIDLVAVRLPSVLATLAMVLVIYGYCRVWMSRFGALAAAALYATCGQVLQLGRLGESEALFTLFVGGSLLVWHGCYLRGRAPWTAWCGGYALAACGALVKGPQAPVYFAGACVVYLVLRRDWRCLFSAAHAGGMLTFAAIVGAWMVPFAVANAHSLDDIWTGLAGDRFTNNGLAKHLLTYPFETLGCLLPWSPLLGAFVLPGVRRTIWQTRGEMKFLLVALAVAYPSVWFAAGARGRYFMPLYPCLAVLMGLVVEHCVSQTAVLLDRLYWRRYLRVLALVAVVAAGVLVTATYRPDGAVGAAAQPKLFLLAFVPIAVVGAVVLVWASLGERGWRPQIGLLAATGFLAVAASGPLLNARLRGANDLSPTVAELQQQLADGELVSLGRVYHRFAYTFGETIPQVPWPKAPDELPEGVTYFCFDTRPGDTPESRADGDGRLPTTTSGTLPFAWEEVARIACDPAQRKVHSRTVVVGRVRRSERLTDSTASRAELRR